MHVVLHSIQAYSLLHLILLVILITKHAIRVAFSRGE